MASSDRLTATRRSADRRAPRPGRPRPGPGPAPADQPAAPVLNMAEVPDQSSWSWQPARPVRMSRRVTSPPDRAGRRRHRQREPAVPDEVEHRAGRRREAPSRARRSSSTRMPAAVPGVVDGRVGSSSPTGISTIFPGRASPRPRPGRRQRRRAMSAAGSTAAGGSQVEGGEGAGVAAVHVGVPDHDQHAGADHQVRAAAAPRDAPEHLPSDPPAPRSAGRRRPAEPADDQHVAGDADAAHLVVDRYSGPVRGFAPAAASTTDATASTVSAATHRLRSRNLAAPWVARAAPRGC